MSSGIEIKLSKLNSVVIAKDGKTATIGGGTISHDLTATLWDAKKQIGKRERVRSFNVVVYVGL